MDEGTTTASETAVASAETAQAARVERRTGVLDLLLCWLQPGRRAPAADRIPLWLAYVIHLAAAVLLFLGACCITDIEENHPWGFSLRDVFDDLLRAFNRWPARVTLAIGSIVLGVEVGYLILAFIFMPWGARDERVRHSFARALRFLWLHSPHAVLLMLVLGAWGVEYDKTYHDYRNKNYYSRYARDVGSPPSYPRQPPNATPGSAAWNDWQKEMGRYVEQSEAYQRAQLARWLRFVDDQPFHIRYGDIFFCWGIIAGSVWFLWSLLRAIGADRSLPAVTRPPTCEFCGYNLTGTPIDSRCSECGTPAMESLGPNARAGTAWEHRGKIGAWRAWWRSSAEAIVQPTRLGHQIRPGEPNTDHRWCAVIPLLPLFLAWAAVLFLCEMKSRHHWAPTENMIPDWVWHWGAWATGASAAGSLFVLGLLAAAIVGTIQSWRYGRNLLPATVRMTSYLGFFGGCWAFFVAVGWVEREKGLASVWVARTVFLRTGEATAIALLAGIEVAAITAAVLLIRYLRKPPATGVRQGLSLGGLLAVWGFIADFWSILFVVAMGLGLSRALRLRLGSSELAEFILMTLLALPHLVALGVGFVLVWKGTTAARYANR